MKNQLQESQLGLEGTDQKELKYPIQTMDYVGQAAMRMRIY